MTDFNLIFWGIALLIFSWEGIKYLRINKKTISIEGEKVTIPVYGVGAGNSLLWRVSTWGYNRIIIRGNEISFQAPEEVNDTALPMNIGLDEIQCVDKGSLPWGNLTFERQNSNKIRMDYQVWFANKKVLVKTLDICKEKGIPLSQKAQNYLNRNR